MTAVLVVFYLVVFVCLFLAAQVIADRLHLARPLPRVTQAETLPPLPGGYVEEVRTRIPAMRGRRARPAPDGRCLLLPCEGWCAGRTRHERTGDGSATCMPCGTPRGAADTDGD